VSSAQAEVAYQQNMERTERESADAALAAALDREQGLQHQLDDLKNQVASLYQVASMWIIPGLQFWFSERESFTQCLLITHPC
jgi:hypothetical protein